jgi:hypothetical protein
MQRFGSFFFVLLFIIFMFIARMSEHLDCTAKNETTISCTRTQDRIFHNSRKEFDITDLNSIALHKRALGSKHNIRALTSDGKQVVLLSVPEKDTAYAEEIIQKLKSLPQAQEKNLDYSRNEMHSQLLLLAVVGLVIFVCVGLLLTKKRPVR